jgi:serine protease Do
VFAVSCRTGELELVGIYHAGYKDAQGLNVVVAVDQLRELLETGRASRREARGEAAPDRRSLVARVRAAPAPVLMPFGDRAVRVTADAAGAVRFELLDAEFPLSSAVQVVLVDRDGDLAEPSAIVLPRRFGDRELAWASLDPALRDPGQRLYDALWRQLAHVVAFRDAEARGASRPDGRAALAASAARIRGKRADQKEILQGIDFDADDLASAAAAVEPRPASSAKAPHGG